MSFNYGRILLSSFSNHKLATRSRIWYRLKSKVFRPVIQHYGTNERAPHCQQLRSVSCQRPLPIATSTIHLIYKTTIHEHEYLDAVRCPLSTGYFLCSRDVVGYFLYQMLHNVQPVMCSFYAQSRDQSNPGVMNLVQFDPHEFRRAVLATMVWNSHNHWRFTRPR